MRFFQRLGADDVPKIIYWPFFGIVIFGFIPLFIFMLNGGIKGNNPEGSDIAAAKFMVLMLGIALIYLGSSFVILNIKRALCNQSIVRRSVYSFVPVHVPDYFISAERKYLPFYILFNLIDLVFGLLLIGLFLNFQAYVDQFS